MSNHSQNGAARELFAHEAGEGLYDVPASSRQGKDRPAHYRVICISMYTDALDKLDEMVRALKARGYTKANRSALIRHALSLVDLDAVPRGL